jgi:predicted RNA polymerase sigma factor
MAQRISRAKQRIRADGIGFRMPTPAEWPGRLAAVLHVLYLIFNEGYAASHGETLVRVDLTAEAIRLTRLLHNLRPNEDEVSGLLALLLLTEARRAARTRSDGSLIPLAEQDRTLWDRALIAEGVALISNALRSQAPPGPYQLQAAIAAVHDEAGSDSETDWLEILMLYELLEQAAPNPVVTLNRAVAEAMVRGPAAGLALLDTLARDNRIATHHRWHAVRAHLLEMAGHSEAARTEYLVAARGTSSLPEKRYLEAKAADRN